MIVGIVASRGLHIEDLGPYIPAEASKPATASPIRSFTPTPPGTHSGTAASL